MDSIAQGFLDAVVPVLRYCGVWMRLGQAGVQAGKKASATDVQGTNIHSALTEVDVLVQGLLEQRLAASGLPLRVFGEEDTVYRRAATAATAEPSHYVTIDPLDGTYAYTQGLDDYCTMLSLFTQDAVVLGVLHFPADEETLVAVAGDGVYRVQRDATPDGADPLWEAGWRLEALPAAPPAATPTELCVHYRFLKAPWRATAEAMAAVDTHFRTLWGDDGTAWCEPTYRGSNGALVRDHLRHPSAGYLAPFVASHDVMPLVAFFLCSGGQATFYRAAKDSTTWQPIAAADALAEIIAKGQARLRVLLSPSAAAQAAVAAQLPREATR